MFDHAGAGLTVWEPGRITGGAAAALFYASCMRQLPGVWLDPVNRKVNFHLPVAADLEPFTLVNSRCKHVALVATRTLVDQRLTALHAAGFTDWHGRRSLKHERHDDGCGDCLEQLAHAAPDHGRTRLNGDHPRHDRRCRHDHAERVPADPDPPP